MCSVWSQTENCHLIINSDQKTILGKKNHLYEDWVQYPTQGERRVLSREIYKGK